MQHPAIEKLPKEWKINRVDALFSIQQGKQVSKKNRVGDNQLPFLRTKNIFWGRLDLSELDRMHFSDQDEQRLSLKLNDLLVCEGGDVGRTAIWQNEVQNCYYQNHLHRLRAINSSSISPEYTLYWLWYAFQIGKIYFGRSNVTTIPNLSKSRLGELPIPKPPLPEQRKIAYILSTVQQAIEQQERLIALTTELKKTLMHKLFTEGLRGEPQKATEIGPVPESWEITELKDAIEFIDYGLSEAIPKNPPEDGVRIVSTADINREGKLLYKQIRTIKAPERTVKRLILKHGDVLFNWRNSIELIGKTTIFEEQNEPHIFASFILRLFCGEKKTHNHYIKHLMNYFRETQVFVKLARRAVNQANYNKNEISVLKIPLPPYQEQVKIAEYINNVETKIEHHARKKELLTELFRTLLHQLMTAQIRVHELEENV